MKKLLFSALMALTVSFGFAQGFEGLIVEKFYVSDANDATVSSNAGGGALPTGSVTYRFYVDLAPGYKFQALYGLPGQEFRLETTTAFFNNEDRGATTADGVSQSRLDENSVMLDSWFSAGAAGSSSLGVLKSEDDGVNTIVNGDGALQNNDASAGIPLTVQDGLVAGSPEAVTFVGTGGQESIFDATSQAGNLFTTTGGSVASLNGSQGPTASNRVLVGQFTTDGVFTYALNLQIGTPTGGVENYVAANPAGADVLDASLSGVLGLTNQAPAVAITAPTNGAQVINNNAVSLEATATDADGSVAQVEFFVDGASVGVDATAPYQANYNATVLGTKTVIAIATDDLGATSEDTITFDVVANPAPVVSITNPTDGANFITGDNISFDVNATDANGSVTQVEFFIDGASVGVDATAPYSFPYVATAGNHTFRAEATDNEGAIGTSSTVSISVVNNVPPTVSITAPVNGASVLLPAVVTIDATAGDVDGSVAQVEFFVNGASVGVDATAPYSVNWNSIVGTANITAVATDDRGASTTSGTVSITVNDPNALPYLVNDITQTCLPGTFCLPVSAAATYNVEDVIGYDVVLNYDNTKVMPTGNVTASNDLVNASFVDIVNSIDAANGVMYISVFFNATAPANTAFTGNGEIFCVEFNETPAFQSVDTAIFSANVDESYVTGVQAQPVQDGEYVTFKDTLFYGSLDFWSDNQPIRYNAANPNQYLITNIFGTDANCLNPSAVSVQPDTAGNFTYNIQNGLSINIDRDILGGTDVQPVINTADRALITDVLVNNIAFMPNAFEIIAMDVNLDGRISAGDASQISLRSSLAIPEFRQAWNYSNDGVSNGELSKDWLFVNDSLINSTAYQISATYPANDGVGFSKFMVPSVPFCLPVPVQNFASCALITSTTYTGILVGDVDASYEAHVADGLIKKTADVDLNDRMIFDLRKAVVEGDFIEIPVSISVDDAVRSFDAALTFDESKMTFESVVDLTGSLEGLEAAHLHAEDRTLRFGALNMNGLKSNESLVAIRFAVNSAIKAEDLSIVRGLVDGKPVTTEKRNLSVSINDAAATAVSIYPNPTTGILYLELAEEAMIQVLDASGREVLNMVSSAQKQAIDLSNVATGVYSVRISNENFVSVQKVVVSNY